MINVFRVFINRELSVLRPHHQHLMTTKPYGPQFHAGQIRRAITLVTKYNLTEISSRGFMIEKK